jgi:hypothetical protein
MRNNLFRTAGISSGFRGQRSGVSLFTLEQTYEANLSPLPDLLPLALQVPFGQLIAGRWLVLPLQIGQPGTALLIPEP